MKLKVQWMVNYSYVDKGCWVLVKGNGHLFAMPMQFGKSPTTKAQLQRLAQLWNGEQK